MVAAFEALREEFRTFGMNGISMVLAAAALLFCIAQKEKLKEGAGELTRYGILFFILLGNPFGYQIIQSFWMKEYWKMFMLILPFVFVAIAITELVTGQKSVWKGAAMAVSCVGIVIISTFFSFGSERIDEIKTAHQKEQEVAAVDEVIRTSGITPENMIAPREVCRRIREINPGVKLMYGEALIEKMEDKTLSFEDEEKQQFVDICTTIVAVPSAVDYQILAADLYGANCILLENAYDDTGQMEQAGFACYGRTEKYAVYFRKTT